MRMIPKCVSLNVLVAFLAIFLMSNQRSHTAAYGVVKSSKMQLPPKSSNFHRSHMLIMSGDSTMHAQFSIARFGLQKTQLRKGPIIPLPTVFVAIAGGRSPYPKSLPSVHSTCTEVENLLNRHALRSLKAVVYMNFGALHLLHVYPFRPWEFRNSTKLFKKFYRYADFQGFLSFENWVSSEINCLETLKQVSLVIVQTPHFVCDAQFTGLYGSALSEDNINETVHRCKQHVVASTLLSNTEANKLCFDGSMTGLNSKKLSARLLDVVSKYSCNPSSSPKMNHQNASDGSKISVCFIDSNYDTSMLSNCSSSTHDGRHYDDSVVLKEVYELENILVGHNIINPRTSYST